MLIIFNNKFLTIVSNLNQKSKNNSLQIYFHFKFYLILILLFSFLKLINNSEINLIIQGEGELNILNNEFYLEPSDVIVNGESRPYCKKKCQFSSDLNNLTIKFNTQIESCENMFYRINNIIEIDLSKFDASNVNNMNGMFAKCTNLIKITFGNINTSLVQSMEKLFYYCQKLITIDRLNFDTLSVTTMKQMFSHCESLLSINAEFNPQNVKNMYIIFGYCYKVVTINLPNFKKTKAINIEGMFYRNYKLKYIDLSYFEVNSSSIENIKNAFCNCTSIVFIKLDSFKINNDTITKGFLNLTYKNLKVCLRDEDTINRLNNYSNLFDCSDICFNENIKIDSKENKCVNNCNEIEFKYEFNNICYNECPDITFPIEDEYLCLDKKPEGYYLLNNEKYAKCYNTCKSCDEGGNENFNNCVECNTNYFDRNGLKYNFLYEININGFKNCYNKCPYYFFEKENKFICTLNLSCPKEYPLLLEYKMKCIENNIQDIIKDILNNERNKTENSKEKEIEFYDNILNIFEEVFISENYNTSNLDNGEDEIIKTEKLIITFTTTENQKNNINNNMTRIDLGECESLLLNYYNLSYNESLYMKKMDIIQEGTKTLKVEYDVYAKLFGTNLIKLNLTACEKSKISISIPIILTGNIDKYNASSGYYNDICYTTISEYGTDILLKDRQIEFIKDKIVCQEDCDFSDYDYNTLIAKCSCNVKKCIKSFADMNIDKSKLLNNFKNIKNVINFNFLKCYNKLFNKEGVRNNIGCFILLAVIIFHILTIFIFIINQFSSIVNKINNILNFSQLSKNPLEIDNKNGKSSNKRKIHQLKDK